MFTIFRIGTVAIIKKFLFEDKECIIDSEIILYQSGGEEEEVSSDLPTSTTDHETHNNNLNLLMFRTPSFGDDSYDLITDRPENFNFTDDIIKNSKIADSPFLPTISSTDISAFLEPNPRDHEVHFSSSESDNFSDNRSLPTISVTSAVSQQYQNQVVPSNSSLQLAQQQQRKYISPLTSQNSLLSRMMSMPRDSILDTLESIAPKFPPQDVDLPDISVTNGLQTAISSAAAVSSGFHSSQIFGQTNITGSSSVTLQTGALTSSVSAPGMTGSPTGSSMSNVSNATPLESSEDSDDSVPLAQLVKRQAEDLVPTPTKPKPAVVKKPRVPKKKKKKDPNEPQKPVSAYALFFRDTQAAIKGQNPNATFGEVSKIVASMWEGLDPDHKDAYKKRTENAKKEYLKQLAAYRANMVSQVRMDESPSPPRRSPPGTSPQHMMGYMNNISPQHMGSPAHMGNPAHMGSPAHLSSPMHAQSPQHISSPHHVTSPQHMSSPQHLMGGHISSPQHMNMTSPQHNMMYDAQRVAQSPPQYNMGGYSNGGQPMDMIDNGMVIDSQLLPPTGGNTGRMMSSGMCIRTGCHNRAIDNIGWDSEYCSNECVVSHCRDVFSAWVSNRQVAPNQFTVK